MKYFGLQYWNGNIQGECFTGNNENYNRYGASTNCENTTGNEPWAVAQLDNTGLKNYQTGGTWLNSVYRINQPPL
jgi:hypothetical protein